jgi:hypothetical protein
VTKLEQAETLIRELTRDELARLRQRIKINLDNGIHYQGTPVEQAKAGGDERILLDAIVRGLEARGLEYPLPSLLMATPVYASFRQKTPGVFKYLRRAACTDVELLGLVTLGMDLLIRDIEKNQGDWVKDPDGSPRKVTGVSARQLMSQVHRIPQVINLAFPGYAEAGLLRMIVRQGQR